MYQICKTRLFLAACALTMVSCGGGSSGSGGGGDEDPIQVVSPNPTPSTDEELSPSMCTEILDERFTTATNLVNFDSPCDYFVDGAAVFTSDVNIEPGTVFLVAEDGNVSFQSGNLIAQGTEDQPIVFRGAQPITGYWFGVSLQNMLSADMQHVLISDGGQNEDAGLLMSSGPISLQNVEVSNSAGYGVYLQRRAVLEQFSNNRFYDNGLAGLAINGDIDATVAADTIAQLDVASDYSGGDQPNGRQVVEVGNFNVIDTELTLPPINAAWEFKTLSVSSDGQLTLLPGAVLKLSGTRSVISSFTVNGVFIADATQEQPIIIERADNDDTPFSMFLVRGDMILNHVQLRGGGEGSNTAIADAGLVTLEGNSSLNVQNTLFEDSVSWGIFCRPSSGLIADISLNNVAFDNNALGDINEECAL